MESSVTKAQNTFVNSQRKSFGELYALITKAEKIRRSVMHRLAV
jgi:hypothetical protein